MALPYLWDVYHISNYAKKEVDAYQHLDASRKLNGIDAAAQDGPKGRRKYPIYRTIKPPSAMMV